MQRTSQVSKKRSARNPGRGLQAARIMLIHFGLDSALSREQEVCLTDHFDLSNPEPRRGDHRAVSYYANKDTTRSPPELSP